MDSKEILIVQAICDLNSGVFTSQRAAAKAYDIPRATLRDRMNGATNMTASHQHQQRLTPKQEEFIVE
jgi:hypothetical protein